MLLTKIKNFSFKDLNGETVSISDFKGKNTLIFMWASWCRCREQLPVWQDFYEKHKNQDFEILSVSVDVQGAEVVKPYAQNKSFTTVIDPENEMANYFGFKVVPNGIFIDKNGIIRLIKQSFYVFNPEHLNALEKLMNGTEEKVVLVDEKPRPVNNVGHLEKQLSETRFKLALQYANNGKKEEALKELDEALLLDTDNFLIRKQRWYIRYPEKFSPTIDMEWQQEQLEKEKAQEATLKDSNLCGSEGCPLPSKIISDDKKEVINH